MITSSDSSEPARTPLLRLGLFLVALSFSVYMWQVNEPYPTQNKELYRKTLVVKNKRDAILAVVSDMKSYAEQHPAFRPVVDRYPVKQWLESP